jgi:hypothetical protein
MTVTAGCPFIRIYSTKTTPPSHLLSLYGGCYGYEDDATFSIANDGPFAIQYFGNILGDPKSAFFILMGPDGMHRTHCDNKYPLFLHGNQNGGKETCDPEEYGTVNSWPDPTIGEYKLYVVAYATPNCRGSFSDDVYSISVNFTIDS